MPIQATSPYGRNSLRPNPTAADPAAPFPFVQYVVSVGDFGGWDASPRRTLGLPPTSVKPSGGTTGYQITNRAPRRR